MISSFGQPSTGWVWRDTMKTNPRVHCATYKQMVGVRAGDPVSSARDSFQFCYGYQEASFLQAAFPYCTACTLEPRFTRTLGRRHRLFLLARVLIVLHPTWFYVSVGHFGTRQERTACTEIRSWKQPSLAAHAWVPSTLEIEQGWSKAQSGEFKVSLDHRRPCLKDTQTNKRILETV